MTAAVISEHATLALGHIRNLFRHARKAQARVPRAVVADYDRAILELWGGVVYTDVQIRFEHCDLDRLLKEPRRGYRRKR